MQIKQNINAWAAIFFVKHFTKHGMLVEKIQTT